MPIISNQPNSISLSNSHSSAKGGNEAFAEATSLPPTQPLHRQIFTPSDQLLESANQTSGALRAAVPVLPSPDIETNKLLGLMRQLQLELSNTDLQQAHTQAARISDHLSQARASNIANQEAIQGQNAELEKKANEKKILSYVLLAIGLLFAIACLAFVIAPIVAAVLAGAAIAATVTLAAVVTVIIAAVGVILAVWDLTAKIHVDVTKATRTDVFGDTVPEDYSLMGLIRKADEDGVRTNRIKVAGVNGNIEGQPDVKSRHQYEEDYSRNVLIVTVVIVVVAVAFSAAAAKGVFGAASTLVQQSSTTRMAGTVLSVASPLISGVGAAAGTALSAIMVDMRHHLFNLKIQKIDLDAVIENFQKSYDENQQSFKNALDFQDRLRKFIATILQEYIEPLNTISQNVKPKH